MQKIGAWPSLGRRTKPAEYQSLPQLSTQFLGDVGRIQLWTRRLGLHRREGFFAQKVTFSATKLLAAGFNPARASTSPGAAGPRTEDC